MTKVVDGDIYGRITNIVYKDDKGDNLYSEILEYKAPLIKRLSSIQHSWADNTAQEKTANESFDYDDLGRLTTFTTDMGGMTGGQYSPTTPTVLPLGTSKETPLTDLTVPISVKKNV